MEHGHLRLLLPCRERLNGHLRQLRPGHEGLKLRGHLGPNHLCLTCGHLLRLPPGHGRLLLRCHLMRLMPGHERLQSHPTRPDDWQLIQQIYKRLILAGLIYSSSIRLQLILSKVS